MGPIRGMTVNKMTPAVGLSDPVGVFHGCGRSTGGSGVRSCL